MTTQELIDQKLRHNVNLAVNRERDYQTKRWGSVTEHPHDVSGWLLIMQCELQRAINEWQKGSGDDGALTGILKVVATGYACMEQHGIRERSKEEYDSVKSMRNDS